MVSKRLFGSSFLHATLGDQGKPIFGNDLMEIIRLLDQHLRGGGAHRRDLDPHPLTLEVTDQFDEIRIPGHDDNGVDLTRQLSRLDGKRNVSTLVTGPYRTMITGMQPFLEFARDMFALAKVHQSIKAAIIEQAGDEGIKVDHGIGVLGLIVDTALDVVTVYQDCNRLINQYFRADAVARGHITPPFVLNIPHYSTADRRV